MQRHAHSTGLEGGTLSKQRSCHTHADIYRSQNHTCDARGDSGSSFHAAERVQNGYNPHVQVHAGEHGLAPVLVRDHVPHVPQEGASPKLSEGVHSVWVNVGNVDVLSVSPTLNQEARSFGSVVRNTQSIRRKPCGWTLGTRSGSS